MGGNTRADVPTELTPGWDGTPIPSPSSGPAWDAAVEYGLDMTLIEHSLTMTPAERAERLQCMLYQVHELRLAGLRHAATKR